MRSSTYYSFAAASLFAGAEALDIFKLRFSKYAPPSTLQRRQHFETPYINEFPVYYVDMAIGTPPQEVRVQLDTGSSDLVVETQSSDYCTANPASCSVLGTYQANSSSTYHYKNSNLVIAYGGGDGASGDYATDIVSIGGEVLKNYEFGIMYKTTVVEGIIGVGYAGNEFQSSEEIYPNLPIALVNGGYIPSRAYSLYLNDDQDTTGGTLLFGGVDTEKYCGPLAANPIVLDDRQPEVGKIAMFVTLEGVTATISGKATALAGGTSSLGSALLDSGTSFTVLTETLAKSIYAAVGATYDPAEDSTTIPCSKRNSGITLNFKFSSITILAPISQFIVFPDDTDTTCVFAIEITSNGNGVILGDTFLSSSYTVYDLDNFVIYLAQAKFGSKKENILQITKGPNGVPHPDGDCDLPPKTTTTKKPTSTTTKHTSTTKTVTTTTHKPVHCYKDSCYKAMLAEKRAPGFCSSFTKHKPCATPYGIGKHCLHKGSKISSACSCQPTPKHGY